MNAEPQSRRPEPIAIVGIAALYPEAWGAGAFWRLLGEDSLHCGCAGVEPGGGASQWNRCGRVAPDGGGLDDLHVDVARFGIPPAQARSMARMQVLMLEAARQCLIDAGYSDRPLGTDRTDVVAGTCFGLDRQYANAQRIETRRYARELERVLAGSGAPAAALATDAADELRSALLERFGGSPHDRVGEMASTIPARVAGAFKLHGRTLTVESADATSYVALAHAVSSLRGNVSDAVLVLTGQRREGPLLASALAAKGLLAPGHPFAADGRGFALGEGVGALLLKRLSSAIRDGDRVYASILDCSLAYDPRPGTFRYSTSAARRRALAARSCRAAGIEPESVRYVECAGSGIAAETAAELAALARTRSGMEPGTVPIGSVRDRLGHTFANAGLAAVSKIALALYHRTVPPHWSPDESAETDLSGTPFRLARTQEPWPARPGAPRRAAVTGASVTGALCHLVLEEYDSRAPSRTGVPARPAVPAEPIAVVGYGGYFADSPDAEGFWRAVSSGRDRIRTMPEERFDRELYHDPGALSLTHSYTDQGAYAEVPDAPPDGIRLTPRRFAAMDGAQRVTLTVAAELFARGPAPRTLRGSGVVAVGSTLSLTGDRRAGAELALPDVEEAVAGLPALRDLPRAEVDRLLAELRERCADPPDLPAVFDGCLASGVAALVAAEYGLDAVPLAVEAACASSLAALDVAISALRTGTADFAVAGGVELACNVRDMVLCSSLGLLSHGKISPFDAGADGFTPGDGCALFLLKRYDDARRDGDPIVALIRGVGASNDAKSLIAPDADGQARAMQQAFEQVDFEPASVDYLEAHGTGTRVGDRVEMAAAAQVYSKPKRSRPLEVGSAKSFFGHTFAAAGSAGLLRTLQAMRNRTLPPNAGLRELSPTLDLHDIPAVISTGASPWRAEPGQPRRAGVSSFGTGGINYHLLVEEHTD